MPPRRKPTTAPVPPPAASAAADQAPGPAPSRPAAAPSTAATATRRKPTRPTTAAPAAIPASAAASSSAPPAPAAATGRRKATTVAAADQDDHHQQPQWPSSAVRRRSFMSPEWPHANAPSLAPEVMAGAGFFFDPALTDADNPDNVTCFECGKQLAHWDPLEDDPAAVHFQKSPQCAYARGICYPKLVFSWTTNVLDGSGGLHYDEADPSTYPKAEEMVNLRKNTFEARWVHDPDPKFFANSTRMAKAGFVYDPDPADDAWTSLDDKATCVYCNLSLANWEPKDNPLTEHKKRNPGCPFFAHITKPRTKRAPAAARPTSGARRQQPEAAPQAPAVKQELEPDVDDAPARRGRGRPRKTPVDERQDTTPDQPDAPRRGRGRPPTAPAAASAASQQLVDDPADPFAMPAAGPAPPPSRKPAPKRKAPVDVVDPAADVPGPAPPSARKPAPKRKAPDGPPAADVIVVEPPAPTARATRSRATTAAAAKPAAPVTRTLRRRRQPGHDELAQVKQEPPADENEDDDEGSSAEPPLKRQRRSSVPPTHIVEVEIPILFQPRDPRRASQGEPPAPAPASPLMDEVAAPATETPARRGVRKPAVAAEGSKAPPATKTRAGAKPGAAAAVERFLEPEPECTDVEEDHAPSDHGASDHDPFGLPDDPAPVRVKYSGRRSRSSFTRTTPPPPPPMQLPLSPPRPPVLDKHPASPTPVDSPARPRGRRTSTGGKAHAKDAGARLTEEPAQVTDHVMQEPVPAPAPKSKTSSRPAAARQDAQQAPGSKTSQTSQSRTSGPNRPKTAVPPPARDAVSRAKPVASVDGRDVDGLPHASPRRVSPRLARSHTSKSAAAAASASASASSHTARLPDAPAKDRVPAPPVPARAPPSQPSRAQLDPVLLAHIREARASMAPGERTLANLPAALADLMARKAREKVESQFAPTFRLLRQAEPELKRMAEEEAASRKYLEEQKL